MPPCEGTHTTWPVVHASLLFLLLHRSRQVYAQDACLSGSVLHVYYHAPCIEDCPNSALFANCRGHGLENKRPLQLRLPCMPPLMGLYLSSTVPSSTHPCPLLLTRSISKMKPGVMLINVSRGGLIESEALFDALESGQIGSLGLDGEAGGRQGVAVLRACHTGGRWPLWGAME